MANVPKIRIINKIKELIAGMTISGGYSRDYGTVDEDDPASIVFPATWLMFPEDEPIDEDLRVINRDTVILPVIFRVVINTASDLDKELGDVNGDFSKMFCDNHDTLRSEGMISADYGGEATQYRLVKSYPGEIMLSYLLKYRWQRSNPYLT